MELTFTTPGGCFTLIIKDGPNSSDQVPMEEILALVAQLTGTAEALTAWLRPAAYVPPLPPMVNE